VALGQVFSEYFGFPCQYSFHRLLDTHHLSSRAGTTGQLAADVPITKSFCTSQKTCSISITRMDQLMLFKEIIGTTVRNKNLVQEEIKWRLTSGNACYHSVQNVLSKL
jgi:hypothetical protein